MKFRPQLIYIHLILNFCCIAIGYSQQNTQRIDSVENYIRLSKSYLQKSIDSADLYIEKAVQLSQTIKNDSLLVKSHLQQSSVYIFKGDFDKADSLLQFNLKYKVADHLIGQTYHNKGTVQYYQKNYNEALEIYLKAAEILENSENPKQLVNTYTNIGTINASLGNYENAKKYLEKAISLSDTNEILKLQLLVNICNVYYELKDYTNYEANIFEAESLAKKYNAKSILSIIYTNLSNYFTDKGNDPDKALSYAKNSIRLKKELNQLQTLNVSYNNVGHSYLKKGEYNKAIIYLDSAYKGASGLLKSYILNNLKEAYELKGDYEKALYYADQREGIKDSMTNAQQKEKVAELTEKYESEKKQQQIEVLNAQNEVQTLTIKQQRYFIVSVILLTLLVIISGFFFFKNYKTKQALDTILLKQRLKKMQLNPHFLFNALQSIQNFIYSNDKEKSTVYLSSYAKLIRIILEKSEEDFISIEEDKIALESYLKLQQLTHNSFFTYTIIIDDSIEEDIDEIPTMVTQPFVENAVLHGVKDVQNGYIRIQYYKTTDFLGVKISDNGKGITTTSSDSKRLHKSMSMNIIKDQLQNLSTLYPEFKGITEVDSSEKGTEIILKFQFF